MFLICFLSVTGFTGFKTHAEKFCTFHSLLFPPRRGGRVLKYCCLVFTDFALGSSLKCGRGSEEPGPELGARGPLSCPVQPVPQQYSRTGQMPSQGRAASWKQKTVIIYSKSARQCIVEALESSSAALPSSYQQMAILH